MSTDAEAVAPPQRDGEEGGGGGMLRVAVEGCCHGELDKVGQ